MNENRLSEKGAGRARFASGALWHCMGHCMGHKFRLVTMLTAYRLPLRLIAEHQLSRVSGYRNKQRACMIFSSGGDMLPGEINQTRQEEVL